MGNPAKAIAYDTIELTGTTDASGDAVVDTPTKVRGEVVVIFVDGTNLTAGADLQIQAVFTDVDDNELLGELITDHADVSGASIIRLYPRTIAQDNTGSNLAGADAVPFIVPDLHLRATIANGGNAVDFAIWIVMRM